MSDEQRGDSASSKIASSVRDLLNEDDELKQMMRDLLKDAITDMRHTIRHGDGASKAALQRLLLPHLAASATASAGKSDIRATVEELHATTLGQLLGDLPLNVDSSATPE